MTRTALGALELSISEAQAAKDVWVTFARSSGEALAMTMTGLSLAPGTTKGLA